ncbi:MAG: hypothetical protein M5T52_04195 [Ignavibacteriaceae bacterium]|nr:hypothetical protein [Ignavibacteriaceae bacterium]
MIKILFFTHAYQDYLSDSLLHSLKSLEGVKVYDYPRKNVLYKNGKDDYGITGNGMTLYYLLDDDQLNRFGFFYPMMFDEYNKLFDDWFNKKYDLVIISNISHQFGYYLQYLPHLKKKIPSLSMVKIRLHYFPTTATSGEDLYSGLYQDHTKDLYITSESGQSIQKVICITNLFRNPYLNFYLILRTLDQFLSLFRKKKL